MRDGRRTANPITPDPERMLRAGWCVSIGDVACIAGVQKNTAQHWVTQDWWTVQPVIATKACAIYYLPEVLDCLVATDRIRPDEAKDLEEVA